MALNVGGLLSSVGTIFGGNQNPYFQNVSNIAGLASNFFPQQVATPVMSKVPQIAGSVGGALARGGAMAEWRRNGAGSQILADLGLGRLRVLGTPRKQVGLAGFGLEVVEYVEL